MWTYCTIPTLDRRCNRDEDIITHSQLSVCVLGRCGEVFQESLEDSVENHRVVVVELFVCVGEGVDSLMMEELRPVVGCPDTVGVPDGGL